MLICSIQDNRRGGGGGGGKAVGSQRAAPPPSEADQKTLHQARATKKNPAEKVEATKDGKGDVGYLPNYVPMGEDRWIQEVYGYWVHYNNGLHLSGGIANNNNWKMRWITLAVMPSRGVFCKKRDKNRNLLGFVPHTYFYLFDPFTNICTSYRKIFCINHYFLVCIFK